MKEDTVHLSGVKNSRVREGWRSLLILHDEALFCRLVVEGSQILCDRLLTNPKLIVSRPQSSPGSKIRCRRNPVAGGFGVKEKA